MREEILYELGIYVLWETNMWGLHVSLTKGVYTQLTRHFLQDGEGDGSLKIILGKVDIL